MTPATDYSHPWVEAARPRTLPAAAAPVLVGAGLAAGDGVFRFDAFGAALVGALAIQVAANFANDASDAHRGADAPDRVGPPRMVAAGRISSRAMWIATAAAVGVATLCGVWLVAIAGWVVAAIGVASVLAMLTYVGGPIPYGYRGLGEVFVFVFFGLAATVGSRYVHDTSAPRSAWILAVPMGMLAAAILVANNRRDIDTDARAGKRTLAVMLGRRRTAHLYAVLTYGAFAVIAVAATAGWTPRPTALSALLAPYAIGPNRTISSGAEGRALIPVLAHTARLELWTGASLGLAAAIAG
ncbi:MAG TPA: 1,4-dihydroxy-2-naphthoate polyprenyltransferase [Acidimicrobiia bacterium]|nr:1,4-dihydroxy-2-naphthoate polyprenyltransferase [Acidimicrobiia bacterium]